jgi:hypothetical protein
MHRSHDAAAVHKYRYEKMSTASVSPANPIYIRARRSLEPVSDCQTKALKTKNKGNVADGW